MFLRESFDEERNKRPIVRYEYLFTCETPLACQSSSNRILVGILDILMGWQYAYHDSHLNIQNGVDKNGVYEAMQPIPVEEMPGPKGNSVLISCLFPS